MKMQGLLGIDIMLLASLPAVMNVVGALECSTANLLDVEGKALEPNSTAMLQVRSHWRRDVTRPSFTSAWISTLSEKEGAAGGMWQHHFHWHQRQDGKAPACGVVVSAFGNASSKYMKTAFRTIRRVAQQTAKPGWCRA